MRSLMWFRADLRVTDNTALRHACDAASRGIVAVFTICPKQWRAHDWADVKVAFVLRTLETLSSSLTTLKIPLLVETCDDFEDVPGLLLDLARKHDCTGLFFNREYEVNERRRDERVAEVFTGAGLDVRAYTDQVMLPPGSVQTKAGDFYSVFTPFKRAWIERVKDAGGVTAAGRPKPQSSPPTAADDVPDRADGFDSDADRPDEWPAGERAATKRLGAFVQNCIGAYGTQRDVPGDDGTSRLSPYLAVGSISVRQCLEAAVAANNGSLNGRDTNAATWISELIWREFYRHVLVGWPRVCMHRAYKTETEHVQWRDADDDFDAWCTGRTGVPIVDAGMRQLATTGWMHNRVRMITAMFLTKQLLIDWRRGEKHFMRHLIDGDLASNNGGWQWSASTGTDAAPYFRIFNPYSQSKRFDPDGAYIRTWVPELRDVPDAALHDPDRLDGATRDEIGYPAPIVDHGPARERAIAAFKNL